jgi:hypothetical protein
MNNPTTRLRNRRRIDLARQVLHDITPAGESYLLGW